MTAYLRRDGTALRAAVAKIQRNGDHYLVQAADGTREKVSLHRPDIAMHVASGTLPLSARQPARPRHVPAHVAMTQADIDVLGDVLSTAFRARDERIAKLELACGPPSTPDRRPARAADSSARASKISGRTVRALASAAVGQARAALALSR